MRRFRWSRAAQQDAKGFYYQPAGLCDDYPEESRTPEKLKRDFETMRATGAKVFRCGIAWESIERKPGVYNWRFWDSLVETAAKYHVELIPYVCYGPEWLGRDPANFWRQPPSDLTRFGAFMFKIASRYRGKVHAWELWNEPDNQDFWLGNAEQYAKMAVEGARGVRRADPNATIILGGLAGGPSPFFQELLDKYKIADVVDVINMHGYPETWDETRLEQFPPRIYGLSDILRKACAKQDIWLAEFGYADYRYKENLASPAVNAFYDYEHTPQYQAIALLKLHIMALASEKLSLTAWYRINDLQPSQQVIGDAANRHLGILDRQGKPKPAFYALRLYNRLFDQPVRCIDSNVNAYLTADSRKIVHVFEKRNGDIIVTGWLRSSTRKEVADTSGVMKDPRSEKTIIVLPTSRLDTIRVYGPDGKRIASTARIQANTLFDVPLTGDGIFLAVLSRSRA